jgi:hypothetical protein
MGLLSAKTKKALQKAVHGLIDDVTINTQVTYRQHKAVSFDPEEQSISSGSRYTNFKPLNALKTFFTDFERYTSAGEIQTGDVRFVIYRDEIRNDPGPQDIIVETRDLSGVTYGIVKVGADNLHLVYIFHCRKV